MRSRLTARPTLRQLRQHAQTMERRHRKADPYLGGTRGQGPLGGLLARRPAYGVGERHHAIRIWESATGSPIATLVGGRGGEWGNDDGRLLAGSRQSTTLLGSFVASTSPRLTRCNSRVQPDLVPRGVVATPTARSASGQGHQLERCSTAGLPPWLRSRRRPRAAGLPKTS